MKAFTFTVIITTSVENATQEQVETGLDNFLERMADELDMEIEAAADFNHAYLPGDEVYWTDPDGGKSSGVYKIVSIDSGSGEDAIYTISNGNSEAEVYESELR